jgi:YfiH family protein
MIESAARDLAEVRLPGAVPRWEVPGWRERFGVVAGATGRGGAGDGPSGFDLGLWTHQPVGEVSARWREFLGTEPGFPAAVISHQVHGTTVAWHGGGSQGWTIRSGLDGHATSSAGLLLLVTVADCVPVYLVDPVSRTCALVHAGWRGVAGGILSVAVNLLSQLGSVAPGNLVMHCGIAISGRCYDVDDQVASACGRSAPAGRKSHLDLRGVLAEQGNVLGVGEVTVSRHCTAMASVDFFSHRRSGGKDGRQVAYLGFPVPGSDAVPL